MQVGAVLHCGFDVRCKQVSRVPRSVQARFDRAPTPRRLQFGMSDASAAWWELQVRMVRVPSLEERFIATSFVAAVSSIMPAALSPRCLEACRGVWVGG